MGAASGDDDDHSADAPRADGHTASRVSAARLDEVFGAVLPDTTGDERDDGGGRDGGGGAPDSWYLEQRPPHHER